MDYREAKVERIVDGDTVVLHNGSIVRYVGITCPEENGPFDKESTEANRKLVISPCMAQVVVYQHKKPF